MGEVTVFPEHPMWWLWTVFGFLWWLLPIAFGGFGLYLLYRLVRAVERLVQK